MVHLDAENAVLTSLFKIFGENPISFVQSEKTISRSKSFELKTTFLNCPSVNVDYFWRPCRIFPAQSPHKTTKMKVFPRKSLRWKCSSGREQGIFDDRSSKTLVEIWQNILTSFRKKRFLRYFEKNTFSSKCSRGYVDCTIDSPKEKFCQKLEKVALKAR